MPRAAHPGHHHGQNNPTALAVTVPHTTQTERMRETVSIMVTVLMWCEVITKRTRNSLAGAPLINRFLFVAINANGLEVVLLIRAALRFVHNMVNLCRPGDHTAPHAWLAKAAITEHHQFPLAPPLRTISALS